jgi:hypothetical protein
MEASRRTVIFLVRFAACNGMASNLSSPRQCRNLIESGARRCPLPGGQLQPVTVSSWPGAACQYLIAGLSGLRPLLTRSRQTQASAMRKREPIISRHVLCERAGFARR